MRKPCTKDNPSDGKPDEWRHTELGNPIGRVVKIEVR